MWKDSDFKEIFQNYHPSPPSKVWEAIQAQLNSKEYALTPVVYFSQSQKLALFAAGIASILFCSFLVSMATNSPERFASKEVSTQTIQIVAPPSHPPQASLHKPEYTRKLSKKTNQSMNSNHLAIPKEWTDYKKELLELAELDRQIDQLGEEINSIKMDHISSGYHSPEPTLLATNTQYQAENSMQRYLSLSKITAIENTSEVSSTAQNYSVKPSKWYERFYLTPFMGANFSQVFYQDRPANNFFSEKAKFHSQIGYNAGVQVGYQFSKRWSLESGASLGQYILGFREENTGFDREGQMYIDQLDIPLLARYALFFGDQKLPMSLGLKGGLMYSSVTFFQVNYKDRYTTAVPIPGQREQFYSFDVDKSQYNSMQLGYAAGIDFETYFSKKLSFNFSLLNAMVSQYTNFPLFGNEKQRPVQFSTSFSVGTKIRF